MCQEENCTKLKFPVKRDDMNIKDVLQYGEPATQLEPVLLCTGVTVTCHYDEQDSVYYTTAQTHSEAESYILKLTIPYFHTPRYESDR